MSEVLDKAKRAALASLTMGTALTKVKDHLLAKMKEMLEKHREDILAANRLDIVEARKAGMKPVLLDRLALNDRRITDMIEGLETVRTLPDPVGEIVGGGVRPNGLRITKRRVPIGVIGIIYEARPNVTVDAAGLALKAGNVVILRGSSSAINSNKAIVQYLREAAKRTGFPVDVVQLIEDPERESVNELITLNKYVDLVIPRGGASLIRTVVENATVPVIETGVGNCHVYVDKDADPEKALKIAYNSKVQRPSVCNACETLLVHAAIAPEFLPRIFAEYQKAKVTIKGDERSRQIDPTIAEATPEDYATEFLDLTIAVRVVDSVEQAIEHIRTYGTKHTEAIVTENITTARLFTDCVDAAALMVNASTRFTDGGEFGFGSEIGISTQKMHARGPMGLPELTTIKYIVEGDGHIRG